MSDNKVSLFTPTHAPLYLLDLYQSLLDQTDQDWEWVIGFNVDPSYPNPAITPDLIASVKNQISGDPRIKILDIPGNLVPENGIGALKKYVIMQCSGKYVVEMDHDDLLTPDAIFEFKKAIDEHSPDVIYSDYSNFREDGTCEVYSSYYGWTSYESEFRGKTYTAMSSFDVNPSTMMRIHFAPNHVRIFNKNTYIELNGHDESLKVADDHDLLCKFYAAGKTFHHIHKMLYLYRLLPDGNNSYLRWNSDIQILQERIGNNYFISMVDRWAAETPQYLKLDMGAAHNPTPGYKSVDMSGNPDFLINVTNGLPFDTSSISVIRCQDFLEHIPPGQPIIDLMNEFYRVLIPGGYLLTNTPAFPSKGAIQDPTHVSFWTNNSFWYYTDKEYSKYVPSFSGRFQIANIWEGYPNKYCQDNDIRYVTANLVALKGQRQPGVVKI
jgi:glycosyltransferase involved in cell wall biosynthesis